MMGSISSNPLANHLNCSVLELRPLDAGKNLQFWLNLSQSLCDVIVDGGGLSRLGCDPGSGFDPRQSLNG
jgi:hypothetical protein